MVSGRVLTAADSGVLGTGRSVAGSELASGAFACAHAKLHQLERVVLQHDLLARVAAEIDHQVRALAGREQRRCRAPPAPAAALIGADLMKLLLVRKRQVKEAAVRRIQHAETILARLHVEIREKPFR